MSKVVEFKPRPVCTNIWNTCTYENCPLKALAAALGPNSYLGNCSGYVPRAAPPQPKSQK